LHDIGRPVLRVKFSGSHQLLLAIIPLPGMSNQDDFEALTPAKWQPMKPRGVLLRKPS
jgi:hypothetical protein